MAMEWQPIETAPKDGTPILIYAPRDELRPVREARWFTASAWRGWWAYDGDRIVREVSVTHWMPMPEPPATYEPTQEG